MSKTYVVSTISTSVAFVAYGEYRPGHVPTIKRRVNILGGANVAHGGGQKGLWTPRGVATPVSSEDMEFLKNDAQFNKMVRKGFLSVVFVESDAELAAADMVPKDKSAPKTPGDFAGTSGRSADEVIAA